MSAPPLADAPCCCHSGRSFADCCAPILAGIPAADCLSLMRSRFSAYVLGRHDHLLATWHSSTCPAQIGGTALRWIGLAIVSSHGGANAQEGEVEFIASFIASRRGYHLHERSRFNREDGQWRYLDGNCSTRPIGVNDTCPCGSGRKFKRCCGKR